jgi:glycerophosphoryl diester phosphodiesterase
VPLPLVIAHRGDSAHRPENTLASFASALEAGVDIVELDVQLTRDQHVVVIHDPTVDRTTNGRGAVATLTLAEVRALSAGCPAVFGAAYAGERVPTLAEVLAFLKGRARILLEIKTESVTDDALGGVEARSIAEVRKADMARDVVILSFDRRALERGRAQAPEITRGHLFHRATPEEVVAGARAVGCDLVLPEKGMLSDEIVAAARAAGLRVASWVVDDPEELRRLARFDLYGVATNRPGVLLEAIQDGLLDDLPSRAR